MLSERKRFSYLGGQPVQQNIPTHQNYQGQSVTSTRRYSRPRVNEPLATLRQFSTDENSKPQQKMQREVPVTQIEYKYSENKKVSSGTPLKDKTQCQNTSNVQSGAKKLLILSKDKKPKTIKDYQEQIQYLNNLNRKIVADTTEQFEKFEKNIEQVDQILKDKQMAISELKDRIALRQSQANQFRQQLQTKNRIIQDFEEEIKRLVHDTEQKDIIIQNCLKQKVEHVQPKIQQIQPEQVQKCHQEIQTQESFLSELQERKIEKSRVQEKEKMHQRRCAQITEKAKQMEEEIYKLKQELYSANAELSLLRQEFSSYKILKEIQGLQMK